MVYDQSKRAWKTVMKTVSVKSRRDSAEAGHTPTSRPARGGHSGSAGFSVWTSKPRSGRSESGRPEGPRSGAARPGSQRTRGVITEVASRRSGVTIPSLQSDERWKEMDKIAPAWVKWL